MRGAWLVAAAVALSGCISGSEQLGPTQAPGGAAAAYVAPLARAIEPEGLEAPAFALLGALARGGPALALGEPSLWAHDDGTLYLAFPGCDTDRLPGGDQRTCRHGQLFRSDDDGATWLRLNDEEDGTLVAEEDSYANGDAEVAVDAAGHVYTSNLGRGIQVLGSADRGDTWAYLGNATPPQHWADRQWMAAGAPGHVIVTWMGGETGDQRAVAVNSTFDGGRNWTGTTYLGERIGWLGQVAMDPRDPQRAYVPFTQAPPTGADVEPTGLVGLVTGLYGAAEFQLLVARTLDGGRTWDVVDTGARVTRSATGGHWSGVLMAPALDVTGDGTVVYGWAEDVRDATGATSTGAVVRFVASKDGGATWSAPVTVSERPTAIMPWVTGGAGDRVAFTYYASDVPLDSDYAGSWDVVATVVDGAGGDAPALVHSRVDEGVHQGGLCARGGLCLLTGSDRALLDFFEADLLPDGRLAIAYPADPPEGGKYIEVRFALQDGGTPLLAAP